MKKINILLALVGVMFTAVAVSGCMVASEKAVFKASDKVDMPDISGAFTDPKHGTFILVRNEGATNSFALTSPDKETMTLIFTPLPTKNRYVVQAANPAGPQVLLGICLIADQTVEFYALKPPAMPPLIKKYDLTVNEKGIMTKKPTDKKLLEFFDECFDPKYSEKAASIKPGSSKDMKDGNSKSKSSKSKPPADDN